MPIVFVPAELTAAEDLLLERLARFPPQPDDDYGFVPVYAKECIEAHRGIDASGTVGALDTLPVLDDNRMRRMPLCMRVDRLLRLAERVPELEAENATLRMKLEAGRNLPSLAGQYRTDPQAMKGRVDALLGERDQLRRQLDASTQANTELRQRLAQAVS